MLISYSLFGFVGECKKHYQRTQRLFTCAPTAKPHAGECVTVGRTCSTDVATRQTEATQGMAEGGFLYAANGMITSRFLIGVVATVGSLDCRLTVSTIQKAIRLIIADGLQAGKTTVTETITSSVKKKSERFARCFRKSSPELKSQESMAFTTHSFTELNWASNGSN